ncbi:TetR/AcrR family transcriptional regulator [Anaerobacillus sp. MEB173]|uniref:TetR/AcrR family transcriptional regulator n=1 Tax=Anaerobacillus sp. MEB173 TaxID=3383345 RepID=UPI003F901A27
MNDRKQHVIKMAHHLFIEKGYQATSIQDILEYSGISKGTFYNYFSSKNELIIALFKSIFEKMKRKRTELLVGQDPSNIEVFIKQIEVQMQINKKNKLFTLFEEVLVSNDDELKQFIKKGQLNLIRWIYYRFIDIFGENNKTYLLDCTIMFMGILHNNMKYYSMVHDPNSSINQVVKYSVERVVKIVQEVAESGAQLNKPELFGHILRDCNEGDHTFQQTLSETVLLLKEKVRNQEEQPKYNELLDFIHDELLHVKAPRKFLIESAISTMKNDQCPIEKNHIENLEKIVEQYFSQSKENV